MKVLDLFSGTGSVTTAVTETFPGAECVSVDMQSVGGFIPLHTVDILKWPYKDLYPSGYFDYIFAGVPCEKWCKFSRNYNGMPNSNEMKLARKVVAKTLEIIKYFKPKSYFIENPRGTFLSKEPCMRGRKQINVDYCMYGCLHKKPTTIFTNMKDLKLMTCNGKCKYIKNGLHAERVLGLTRNKDGIFQRALKKSERGAYPKDLIKFIFTTAAKAHGESCVSRSGRVCRIPQRFVPQH